jgi:hypothetical protein
MRKRQLYALILVGLLAGCVTSDHLYLVRREVTCSDADAPVEFLARPPERPYVEIARLEASGRVFAPVAWEKLRVYLCEEALLVDADAVVALQQEDVDYSFGFTPLKVDWVNKRLVGTAIQYLDPSARPDDVEVPPITEGGY